MSDSLRDRIAAAIYNSSDDYTRKLMVRPDCPGASDVEGEWKPVCYRWADAVIRELRLQQERGIKECGETEPGVINFNPENLVKYMRKGEVMMHRYITGWENA